MILWTAYLLLVHCCRRFTGKQQVFSGSANTIYSKVRLSDDLVESILVYSKATGV